MRLLLFMVLRIFSPFRMRLVVVAVHCASVDPFILALRIVSGILGISLGSGIAISRAQVLSRGKVGRLWPIVDFWGESRTLRLRPLFMGVRCLSSFPFRTIFVGGTAICLFVFVLLVDFTLLAIVLRLGLASVRVRVFVCGMFGSFSFPTASVLQVEAKNARKTVA